MPTPEYVTVAEELVKAAEQAVAAVSRSLQTGRELAAAGELDPVSLGKLRQAFEDATEQLEIEKAGLAAARRREMAANQAAADLVARAEFEARRQAQAELDREATKYAKWLGRVVEEAEAFNAKMHDLSERTHAGVVTHPGRWTSWGLLATALQDQMRHYPTPGHQEASDD